MFGAPRRPPDAVPASGAPLLYYKQGVEGRPKLENWGGPPPNKAFPVNGAPSINSTPKAAPAVLRTARGRLKKTFPHIFLI